MARNAPTTPTTPTPTVLTGVDVPDHLSGQLTGAERSRRASSAHVPCGHATISRAWAPGHIDALLCPQCFDTATEALAWRLSRQQVPCLVADCTAAASVVAQVPVRRDRRPGSAEVVVVGFCCTPCAQPRHPANDEGGGPS